MTLSEMARAIENPAQKHTASQQMMIEDGLPPALIMTAAERKAAWKGVKLTKPDRGSVKITRNEEPATRALRLELEKKARDKQTARLNALKERKALQRKQENPAMKSPTKIANRRKPLGHSPTATEIKTMADNAAARKMPKAETTKAPAEVQNIAGKPEAGTKPVRKAAPPRAEKPAKAAAPKKAAKPAPAKKTAPAKAAGPAKPRSGRADQVIALMKRPGGVTVEQIGAACDGMLPHSARALISGIAKTEKVEKDRPEGSATIYRIK